MDSNLIDKIAEKMGELCGAARGDWANASPDEVGPHGVPVKHWRDAYFEGCKDMAEVIASVLPDGDRDRVKAIAQRTFHTAYCETHKAEAPRP